MPTLSHFETPGDSCFPLCQKCFHQAWLQRSTENIVLLYGRNGLMKAVSYLIMKFILRQFQTVPYFFLDCNIPISITIVTNLCCDMHTVIRGRWVLCDWFLLRLPIQATSRTALSAVQELKIRRPRTDKIVTILQCLYLINGKVK